MGTFYGNVDPFSYTVSPASLRQTNTATVAPRTSSGFAPEVMALAGQLTRERAKAGVGTQNQGPGLLGKIFDVVSRPLYASANAVNYLQTGENPLEGAWRGISGQDKTTYDDVLSEAGMGGGWQRSLAGFAGDIFLDPSTYVGAGIVKDLPEGIIRKAATETALSEVAGEAGLKKGVKDTAKRIFEENTVRGAEKASSVEARANALLNLPSASKDPVEAARTLKSVYENAVPAKQYDFIHNVTKKESNQLAKLEHADNIATKAMEAQDAARATGRGKLVLKIAGRPTSIGSEKLYRVGSKGAEIARELPIIGDLNKAFRTQATMRDGANDIFREAAGHAQVHSERMARRLGEMFGNSPSEMQAFVKDMEPGLWGGLDKGHRQMITHALEDGTDLSGITIPATGKSLEEYKQAARNILDNFDQIEQDFKIRPADSHIENYVPHQLSGGTRDQRTAWLAERRAGAPTAAQLKASEGGKIKLATKPTKTLKEAEIAGLKPETDIQRVLADRANESFQNQGRARFYHGMDQEFGLHLKEDAKGLGKEGIKSLEKKLNLEKVSSPYFQNGASHFHPDQAKIIKSLDHYASESEAAKGLLKHYDAVQRIWKLNMTALNPGHHIRNMAGDIFLNWEDGVKNPFVYQQAASVLKNWEKNPEAVILKVGKRRLNAGQIMTEFTNSGAKAGYFRTEMVQQGIRPIEKIRQLAETREDWTRMAHFIDQLKKSGKNVETLDDLKAASRVAGHQVRKFNIDYADLTDVERKFFKRVVPFYTWMRKNIPIQLETLAMNPSKIGIIPKGLNALQGMMGTEGGDNVMGFNVMPQWLREMAGVRIFGEGQGRNGVYWNPSVLPFSDIQTYFGGGPKAIAQNLLNTTTPMLRMPIEQATGVSLYSGGPVQSAGPQYYGGGIIPPVTNPLWQYIKGEGDVTDLGKLLGLSLYNVGPKEQLGELRRQEDPIQAILKAQSLSRKPPRSWEPGGSGY
jgi:hypothetical protein